MGQKTHPLGFRLGIIQKHQSIWYANFNKYSEILQEDDKLRTYIHGLAALNGISSVKINRNGANDQIQIDVETGKPGILVGDRGRGLQTFFINLQERTTFNQQLRLNIYEVQNVGLNATLLADFVVEELEKRVAFRKAIRGALQKAKNQNVKGIKIQVSGRLNGAEMARTEWIREGRVPLQTLRADIDYATKEAKTIYGILGIKIWLFKSEILTK